MTPTAGTRAAMTPEADPPSQLAEGSGAAEAEQVRAEKVQSALYRIAELAGAAQDMQEFYRAVHAVVADLMPATNFEACEAGRHAPLDRSGSTYIRAAGSLAPAT